MLKLEIIIPVYSRLKSTACTRMSWIKYDDQLGWPSSQENIGSQTDHEVLNVAKCLSQSKVIVTNDANS